jgi:hypothetical protein
MTTERSGTLVFKSATGDYFLLPQATLERGRVPEEHRAEVEHLVVEAEGDDVSGHVAPLAIFFAGALLGGGTAIGTIIYLQNDGVPNEGTGTLNPGLHR